MESCPRVNGSQLPQHIGSAVTLVGRTKGLGSTSGARTLQLELSDQQTIKLHLQQPLNEPLSMYVEVVGLVESNLSLSVSKITNWGNDFGAVWVGFFPTDLEAYDQVVQLIPQFPSLFTTTAITTT